MITISKFIYKNIEPKIKIHPPINMEAMKKLRKMESFNFTRTHICYYVDYSKQSYHQLQSIFSDINIIGPQNIKSVEAVLQKENIQKQLTDTKKSERPITTNLKSTDSKTTYNTNYKVHFTIDKERNCFYAKHTYNKSVFDKIFKLEGCYWEKENKQWIIRGTNELYTKVKNIFIENNFIITKEYKKNLLELETEPKIRTFIEALKMKNYSINTIDCYLPHFKEFVNNFKNQDIDNIHISQIKSYVADTIIFKQLSEVQQKHLISAVKFYYEKLLGRSKIYFTLRKKYEFENDDYILSLAELSNSLETIKENKQKLIILLHYGYGISINELIILTLQDIKKLIADEFEIKSEKYLHLKNTLINHYQENKPEIYVFEKNNLQTLTTTDVEKLLFETIEEYHLSEIIEIQYKNLLEKSELSYITKKNYLSDFMMFLKFFNYKHPNNITDIEIRKYLFHCKENLKLSTSYINNLITTIKFYYLNTQKRKIETQYLLRPKREKQLPTILSPNEIMRMINVTNNIKHKNIIALLYASGLRRSELLNMQTKDIDFERDVITIKSGKGNKDRQTLLSENFKTILSEYLRIYNPKLFLFEGATGNRYGERSLEEIVKKSAKVSGITKRVTPHTLRHSFATHLLEQAVDIRYIQELLGHSSIKTTERYTHVANSIFKKITSPLDKLDLSKKKGDKNKSP